MYRMGASAPNPEKALCAPCTQAKVGCVTEHSLESQKDAASNHQQRIQRKIDDQL
ncbi:hypothetical protein QG37_03209 [Candidozyma auris]|nr:hypothetical protein QG37_03209 [[Candida] auris]